MLTLFMAFVVVIVTWVGNVALAYVRASLSPAFAHQLHAKSRSAWCFCSIFLRGSRLITRNKHSADDPETRYILLLCQPAFTMGDNSGLAPPPCVVVQVSPGRTHLRMD
jgi:hypothetical protein